MDWLCIKLLICLCTVTIFAAKITRERKTSKTGQKSVISDISPLTKETIETIEASLPESKEEINETTTASLPESDEKINETSSSSISESEEEIKENRTKTNETSSSSLSESNEEIEDKTNNGKNQTSATSLPESEKEIKGKRKKDKGKKDKRKKEKRKNEKNKTRPTSRPKSEAEMKEKKKQGKKKTRPTSRPKSKAEIKEKRKQEKNETTEASLPESEEEIEEEAKEEINIETLKAQLRTFIVSKGRHERLAAGLVRLSFHDCVGGCDGCINLDNPDNRGLGPYIKDINLAYKRMKLPPGMSRADFWILGAIVAIESTIGTNRGNFGSNNIRKTNSREITFKRSIRFTPVRPQPLHLVFKEGRVDCDTSPTTTAMHSYPNAMEQLDATVAFFQEEFGFNQNETIALLGAHTLGKCERKNSGFVGPWVGDTSGSVRGYQTVNSDYYKEIINNGGSSWKQVNKGNKTHPKWQWDSDKKTMMLNIDIGLAYHMKWVKRKEPGKSACKIHDNDSSENCPDSDGKDLVDEYARDNNKWLEDFSDVFNKMINHGCSASVPCG